MASASAFVMVVFATPGIPSRRTWPFATSAMNMSSITSVFPAMCFLTSAKHGLPGGLGIHQITFYNLSSECI